MSSERGTLAYRECIERRCDHPFDTCPRNGQRWPSYVKYREEHNQSCESLVHMWTPTYGGVSCPSDLFNCDGCDVMFYVDGMRLVENRRVDPDDPDELYDYEFCQCCYMNWLLAGN